MNDARPLADDGDAAQKYLASQWKLMWWKFLDHRMAVVAGIVLVLLYLTAAFSQFIAPSDPYKRNAARSFASPQRVHLFHEGRVHRPFVYPQVQVIHPETLARTYEDDRSRVVPIRFFAHGDPYLLFGLIPSDIHLIGADGGERIYLMGADRLGRDLYSRILYGSRISLTIGLVGVVISLALGIVIGGFSGYYGGMLDVAVQRIIEVVRSFPMIPLWLALSAAMPPQWSSARVFLCITIILALITWTDLARVVRGKILALREEDYAIAAKVAGVRETRIVIRHLIPGFASHLIVSATLAVPAMIMAETSLSFLRLGIRPPAISWGVLLQDAQNVRAVVMYPWLMLPVVFVIVAVLMFNFLGDGLRDAADPYSH
jgi:peptide/nickel transport system permease protein